jgi:predicted outer membrane repeat protein
VSGGHATLRNVTVSRSSGGFGAIQAHGPGTQIACTECLIRDNGGTGGAFFVDGGSLQLTRCVFSRNVVGRGGGVVALTKSQVVLDDCVMEGNVAQEGAALYAQYSCTVWMNRCTVRDNVATQDGGAIYCASSHLIFNHTTFHNNSDPAHASRADAVVYCSDFPVHSPCLVDGFPGQECVDSTERPSGLSPTVIAVLAVSAALLIGALVLVILVIRSVRRRKMSIEMSEDFLEDNEETAGLIDPDLDMPSVLDDDEFYPG